MSDEQVQHISSPASAGQSSIGVSSISAEPEIAKAHRDDIFVGNWSGQVTDGLGESVHLGDSYFRDDGIIKLDVTRDHR